MSEKLEAAAVLLEAAAVEPDEAAKHCRTAAGRFRDGAVSRAAAHAWAARGHVLNARASLDDQAREHARQSIP